ncbi:XkdX family protein [Paenibacillus provencensis]|uniref:XkdX family protein n=1 Tax=Paenibacillus provencensis TaxID=441151 RepID=A0ABW3Q335_9BACL|nr:XkdX family protein [Paenibacillus sp. MER 78]MCM3130364.1 XkdX family protein [Paenibacillus sp. MER 78]
MWYATVKRFYDTVHPAYTNESLKTFVVAQMISADQYKQITNVEYEQ